MEYYQHITTEGERWDTIAYDYYGDARHVGRLMLANAHLPGFFIFPAETVVFVPIVADDGEATEKATILPPWKR